MDGMDGLDGMDDMDGMDMTHEEGYYSVIIKRHLRRKDHRLGVEYKK